MSVLMKRNRRHTSVYGTALVMLFAVYTSHSVATAQERSLIPEHYILGRIRILYAKEGLNAVSPADIDQNGVPDQVKNVAKQLWAAHHLFCERLEFPDPFESERYKRLTCIQVSIRHRDEIGGGNGVAYERAQRARRIPEGKPDDQALVMAIASQLDPIKNGTPAHELFHLIQYGATYFKKGWYLEGQARWSEHALAKDGIGEVKYSPNGPWPQKLEHLKLLVEMKYDAEFVLWNPIAARSDRDGLLTDELLGKELTALRYSDGSPVVADRSLYGAAIMRDILIELGKQDDVAFKELQYDRWSEANETSEQNNPYIYKAIMDVLRRHGSRVGRFTVPRPKR
jgi:hypothetical protein